jgi:hypothetical protein
MYELYVFGFMGTFLFLNLCSGVFAYTSVQYVEEWADIKFKPAAYAIFSFISVGFGTALSLIAWKDFLL